MNIPANHQHVLGVLASRDLDANASRALYQQLYHTAQTRQAPPGIQLLQDSQNATSLTALHVASGTFVSLTHGPNGTPLMRTGRLGSVETVVQGNAQTKMF